jgi:hypothetical protein
MSLLGKHSASSDPLPNEPSDKMAKVANDASFDQYKWRHCINSDLPHWSLSDGYIRFQGQCVNQMSLTRYLFRNLRTNKAQSVCNSLPQYQPLEETLAACEALLLDQECQHVDKTTARYAKEAVACIQRFRESAEFTVLKNAIAKWKTDNGQTDEGKQACDHDS